MKKCKFFGCNRQYFEWIPKKKRMPKINQYIFVWDDDGNPFHPKWYMTRYDPMEENNWEFWAEMFDGPNGEKLK